MSELKEIGIRWEENGELHFSHVYLKSEADKVIAELTDKLQKESALLKETREWLIESQKMHKRCADNAVKVIRHQKYKRCFAMAMWCDAESCVSDSNGDYDAKRFFIKWLNRWLELYDKFKEAE